MKKEKSETKKKYEKPVLRVICIAPGVQTLGTGCKLEGLGPTYGPNPCESLVCATVGS